MPRNVEIKARIRNLEDIVDRAKELSKSNGEEIKQHDVFFTVPHGRLKLRKFEDETSELIYYQRDDSEGPKVCMYGKSLLPETTDVLPVLTAALGIKGKVSKTRHLFIVDQTRVHIDHVEGLGDFMELEVMLKDDQSAEEGQAIANKLMAQLGVDKSDLLSGAYLDLLQNE